MEFFDYAQIIANWLSPVNSIWTSITAIGGVVIGVILGKYSKKNHHKGS